MTDDGFGRAAQRKRQLFFLKQKLYRLTSALLLDNRPCGNLRARLLGLLGARIGRRVVVRGSLQVLDDFDFDIADDVFINADCCLDGSARITIGARTHLGFQVTLVTMGHDIGVHDQRAGPHVPAPITVGAGCWIGAGSMILPGVVVGDGAVVAARSVVTRDVARDTVVAGAPARVVRSLES